MKGKSLSVLSILLSIILMLSCGCTPKKNNGNKNTTSDSGSSANSNYSSDEDNSSSENDSSFDDGSSANQSNSSNSNNSTGGNNSAGWDGSTTDGNSNGGNNSNSGNNSSNGNNSTTKSDVKVVFDKTKKPFFYALADQSIINKYITEAANLRDTIKNSKSSVKITGKTYYVSSSGNDSNNGRSPDSPIKTIKKVNKLNLQPGDGVLFKRGDKFRTTVTLQLKNGVTYSAYGTGEKPQLTYSVDASSPDDWVQTKYPNIYRCKIKFPSSNNVGTIIFNGGEAWGVMVQKTPADGFRVSNGTVFNGYEYITDQKGVKFKDESALINDLEFYNSYDDVGYLYLYSKSGNPGKRFKSIEITHRVHGMYTENGKNIVIDNLELYGVGAHGILIGHSDNCTIQYCKFSWIGGSIHSMDSSWRKMGTRWGNAVEAWNCDNHRILYCHAEQVYDSCFTVQTQGGDIRNVEVANCLVDFSYTPFEYWINNPNGGLFENIYLHNNYTVYPGFGFSHQRPHFDDIPQIGNYFVGSGYNNSTFKNASVSNNVNIIGGGELCSTGQTGTNQFNFNNNVYINMEKELLGALMENPGNGTGKAKDWYYTEASLREAYATGWENGSKFYYITAWPFAEMFNYFKMKNY